MKKRIALLLAMTVVSSLASVSQSKAAGPTVPWVKVVVLACKATTGDKIQAPMIPPGFSKGAAVAWSLSCGKGKPTVNNSNPNFCFAIGLGSKPPKDPLHILSGTGPSNCNVKAGGFFTPVPGVGGPWCGMSNGSGGGTLTNKTPFKVTTISNIDWISRTGGLLIVTADHDKGQIASPGVVGAVLATPDQLKQEQGLGQGSCLRPNKGAKHFIAVGILIAVGTKKVPV